MKITGETSMRAINSKGLPIQRIRDKNADFYNNIQLYEYTPTGQNTNPITDSEGNPVYVKRIIRHIDSMYDAGKINKTVSVSLLSLRISYIAMAMIATEKTVERQQ